MARLPSPQWPSDDAVGTVESGRARMDGERLARLVGELSDSVMALAALAAAVRHHDSGAEHGAVLGALGLAVPVEGGWRLVPAAAAAAARAGDAYAARFTASLRWAAAAAEGRAAWADQDLETKAAQGFASSPGGHAFVELLAPQLGDLSARLAAPGAVALDVGTGVGELAVALAEAAPALHVVGLDVLDDVLTAARALVAERGLVDRVVLRHQDVAALTDTDAFDLAYLPAYFVPEPEARAALSKLWAALRPGGWLLVPVRERGEGALAEAVERWLHPGCAVWSVAETERSLADAGFADLRRIRVGPLAPVVVAGARPGLEDESRRTG